MPRTWESWLFLTDGLEAQVGERGPARAVQEYGGHDLELGAGGSSYDRSIIWAGPLPYSVAWAKGHRFP